MLQKQFKFEKRKNSADNYKCNVCNKSLKNKSAYWVYTNFIHEIYGGKIMSNFYYLCQVCSKKCQEMLMLNNI